MPKTPEKVMLLSDQVVYAREIVIRVCHRFTGAQVIVHTLGGSSGPIRIGIKLDDFARDPVDARRRNDIAGKRIANKLAGAAGIGPRGARIVDDVQITVAVACLREIARLLRGGRYRSEHLVGRALADGLIVEKEKGAIADDGAA